MRRGVRLGLALLLCAALTGCGSPKEAAYRSFSEANACPRDRVTAAAIEGVTMRDLWLRDNPLPDPPADVGTDPARRAVWRAAREKEREGVLRGLGQYRLFHVSGCGAGADYACFCPPHTGGSVTGRGSRQDFCGCEPAPDSIAQGRTDAE